VAITDDDLKDDPPEADGAAGALQRRDFSGVSVQRDSIATQALVAQARASVEARYVMAMQRPRKMDEVRARLMKECRRPGFAEVARYSKPMGDGKAAEGPSIRFAEAAARSMGNIYTEQFVTYEDDERIVMRVAAMDLETNVTYPVDVRIRKAVEVRNPPKGSRILGKRTNSQGKDVFLIPADEDRLANVIAAKISKALRGCLLRIMPGDLIDDGQEVCMRVASDRAAKDPDGNRKRAIDAYSGIGIMPADLERWLGRPFATVTAPELVDLSKIFATVRDGEATWADVLEARLDMLAERSAAAEKPSDPVTAPKLDKPVQPAPDAASAAIESSTRKEEARRAAALDAKVAALSAELEAAKRSPEHQAREEAAAAREKQGTFDQAAANARAADAARESAAVAERQARERAASAPPSASKGASAAKAALDKKKSPPARQEPPPQRDDMEEPEWMRGGYKSVDEDPV
jgi:hypothetical protein